MRKRLFLFFIMILIIHSDLLFAQSFSINKVEPPNWWTGMKWKTLDLMFYGENLQNVKVETDEGDLQINNISHTESGKYLFVSVSLYDDIEAGNYQLIFKKNNEQIKRAFTILPRFEKPENHIGFNSHDVIYLITPDRFANGDTKNDRSINGMPNQLNRKAELARHGGDIKGIIDKLPYLKNLGITAIWINPLVTNNMPISYHGYAATDFYQIDPRFGTNRDYRQLVSEAHKYGIKVILDHVSNHMGINHPWIKNPPFANWIHGTIYNHLASLHKKMSYFDTHGALEVTQHLEKGWFVNEMPDLNQDNPHVAKYIIQNTIWWMEYAGIDGIREDTYSYVNPFFLSNWGAALLNEYPKTNIVGEVWSGEPAYLAAYQRNSKVRDFNTYLPSVTDFALRDAFADFLQGKSGMEKFYSVFSKDYLYSDENNLLTFIDNHDLERPMFLADGNIKKVKLAYVILFTTRGIPEILYGDEIGLKGGRTDGEVREDFPGGWNEDMRNAFIYNNLTRNEKDLFNHIKLLIDLRKRHPALASGRMIHFPVKNNVYYYIKSLGQKKYLIVLNGNDKGVKPNFYLIKERINLNAELKDLVTNKLYKLNEMVLSPYDFKILEIE